MQYRKLFSLYQQRRPSTYLIFNLCDASQYGRAPCTLPALAELKLLSNVFRRFGRLGSPKKSASIVPSLLRLKNLKWLKLSSTEPRIADAASLASLYRSTIKLIASLERLEAFPDPLVSLNSLILSLSFALKTYSLRMLLNRHIRALINASVSYGASVASPWKYCASTNLAFGQDGHFSVDGTRVRS